MRPTNPSGGLVIGFLSIAALWSTREAPAAASENRSPANQDQPRPAELGQVAWERSLDSALERACEAQQPLFALFLEVPGCATCVGFGDGPLSEPLLVEAIETLFVPLAIFNNRKGADAEALRRFEEPAWNNPVVRLLDASGSDLIPRADGIYTTHELAARMTNSLTAAERPAPPWLESLALEGGPLASATFRTACFWQGEAHLGSISGVATTRAGWVGGHEVVTVRFDEQRLSRARLVERARELRCVEETLGQASDARASDQHYFLRRTRLTELDLNDVQRTKLNALVYERKPLEPWLSPRQLKHLAELEQH